MYLDSSIRAVADTILYFLVVTQSYLHSFKICSAILGLHEIIYQRNSADVGSVRSEMFFVSDIHTLVVMKPHPKGLRLTKKETQSKVVNLIYGMQSSHKPCV